MADFEIREASLADADEAGRLISASAEKFIAHEFSAESRQRFLSSLDGKSIAQNIERGYAYYVAIDSTQIVGVIGIRNNSHIFHLFVAEQYHGHGLARQLWNRARDECRRKGGAKFFTVNSSNNAVKFYENLGFERKGPMTEKDGVLFTPMEYRNDV